jgi:hypothetical protein
MKQQKSPCVEIIDPAMVECLRRLTPAQRLTTAFNMWETARVITGGAVRSQFPQWTEEQVNREVARRLSHGATERVER